MRAGGGKGSRVGCCCGSSAGGSGGCRSCRRLVRRVGRPCGHLGCCSIRPAGQLTGVDGVRDMRGGARLTRDDRSRQSPGMPPSGGCPSSCASAMRATMSPRSEPSSAADGTVAGENMGRSDALTSIAALDRIEGADGVRRLRSWGRGSRRQSPDLRPPSCPLKRRLRQKLSKPAAVPGPGSSCVSPRAKAGAGRAGCARLGAQPAHKGAVSAAGWEASSGTAGPPGTMSADGFTVPGACGRPRSIPAGRVSPPTLRMISSAAASRSPPATMPIRRSRLMPTSPRAARASPVRHATGSLRRAPRREYRRRRHGHRNSSSARQQQ